MRWESTPCPLCRTSGRTQVLKGPDRLHQRPGLFSVVRCVRCDLLRTDPRPTADTITYFYPDSYQPYQAPLGPPPQEDKLTVRQHIARRLFAFNSQILPPHRDPGRLFEIGTGSGGFLRLMAARGWDVAGLEYSASAARRAQEMGLSVEVSTVEDGEGPDEPVDVVAAWMVLEHLHKPLSGLRKIRGWLNKDGWLVGSVPNVASLDFRLFRDAWYALQLPTHLYHFTPKTLTALLQTAGFSVERIFHQRTLANYPPSMGYRLDDYLKGSENMSLRRQLVQFPVSAPRWVPFALYPLAYTMAALGQTGRMTFWARADTPKIG
ncbi:MAG: class I SAM-dependent methyltransferase [Myxococcales bacterium]|nr:class I SAM-dependent methyltransferase [Myxococcales bacterium]